MSILIVPLNLWIGLMTTPYIGVVHAQENSSDAERQYNEDLEAYKNNNTQENFDKVTESGNAYKNELDASISNEENSIEASQIPTQEGTQAEAAVGGIAGEPGEDGNAIVEGSGEFLQCGLSSILASLLQNVIGGLIGNLTSTIQAKVPILNPDDNAKDKGLMIFGIPVLPSWDAVGYCLVNMIISYIAQSTIQWVNSGFNGNPAFINDPSGFLQGIADIEANIFLDQLGGGFLCEPYQSQVQQSIHSIYLQDYPQASTCSFTQQQGEEGASLEEFLNGDITTYQALRAITGRNNNIYDLTWDAQRQLEATIDAEISEHLRNLDYGNGFFPAYGENGLITVPGSSIYDSVNRRTNLPIDRILGAKDFDHIVTQLVEQLVRVALGELFGAARGAINEGIGEINKSLR